MSQKSEQAPDEFLSTEQAAEIAGVNVRTILRWWDAGLIGGQSIPIGSRTLRRVSRLSLQSRKKARSGRVTRSGLPLSSPTGLSITL